MPHPADTNWGIRSDTDNDTRKKYHPARLVEEQPSKQEVEPSFMKKAGPSASTLPAEIIFAKVGRNLNSYITLLKSAKEARSAHTVKMSQSFLGNREWRCGKSRPPKKRSPEP